MKRPYDDSILLRHILSSIEEVEGFTANILHRFHEIPVVWNAALRQLQVMTESTQRLSEGVKAQMPEIEWRRISGFRNVLVHDYLGDIDPIIVRAAIEKELPRLKEAVSRILKNMKDEK